MRFFYRIFTPMKVKPIKIVNTTLSTGGKQLQIVPVKPSADAGKPNDVEPKAEPDLTESEDQKNHKERLFAHLQLQSKSQVVDSHNKKVPDKPLIKDCVFEYEEPDQEEIKRFAEKRDREWALQKKLDDETRKDEGYVGHHFSKKRKKSKHSKSEFNVHKKRKLHAEIASNEEDLKLKVKITNNGHKHKHHKSSGQVNEKTQTADMSSKEKLLQMRQVRHKHVSSEDKNIQTVPNVKASKDSSTSTEIRINSAATVEETGPIEESKKEEVAKLKIKISEPSSSVSESAVLPKQQSEGVNTSPKIGTFVEPTNSKPGFSLKNSVEKDWGKKVPRVELERNEQTEKQAQKTFLKTFQTYAEKYQRNEKLQQNKIDTAKTKLNLKDKTPTTPTKLENKITTTNKSLERKIANLQQHCTIEAKVSDKEKKISYVNNNDKAKVVTTTHYPAGFTVSKIEQGAVKRKNEDDSLQDKRPSLEITLINPPPSPSPVAKPADKPPVKRPPPATIPLDRIKKSVNLKSGISIIPKLPERCDNIGALDLSKSSKSPDSSSKLELPNGFNILNRQVVRPSTATGAEKNNMALSNLQMLSKVATEHSNLNNKAATATAPALQQPSGVTLNKPRPQMPSLQTLKVPSLPNPGQMKAPNLQKLPKLNEIQKFRPANPQIRNLRPNQNQNIRNIPNPSLLIRQQNQNRLSQMATMQQQQQQQQQGGGEGAAKPAVAVAAPPVQKETVAPAKPVTESKVQEKKEISV
ncbi:hypothetical protein NQ315_000123 [Exocentrus adspersus]|uniref:Uncharacterized protein n=1 Tax=Exocentrus adspersus TaxID=1586481 RepID=A0AAV8VRX0_9CUCU|nr:hypothetical protein NQ315_000123 [Exocentrus adspersus]